MLTVQIPDVLVAADPLLSVPPPWRWITKWGYFVGLAALIGAPLVHVLAIRPALRKHANADVTDHATRLMHRTIGASAVLFAALYWPQLASVAARNLEVDFSEGLAPATIWAYVTQPAKEGAWFGPGVLTGVQAIVVIVVLVLLVPLLWRPRHVSAAVGSNGQFMVESTGAPVRSTSKRVFRGGEGVAVSVAVPLTIVVTVVKSIPNGGEALVAHELVEDVLVQSHIIGGSVWIGGLAALALLTRAADHIKDATVDTWSMIWHRFSVMAMVSVGAICVSGAWMTWTHVGSLGQLLSTPFGRMLTIKVTLVALLISFGAFNQMVLMPRIVRLRRAGQADRALHLAVSHFGRIVLVECAIGVLVLLAVGLLTGSARGQGGSPDAVVDPTIYGAGLGLIVAVVALFAATSRLGRFLADRPLARPVALVPDPADA